MSGTSNNYKPQSYISPFSNGFLEIPFINPVWKPWFRDSVPKLTQPESGGVGVFTQVNFCSKSIHI